MILILTLAFFAGLVYHTVNLTLHTKEWVASPMNRHLPEHDQLEYAGKIIDRNGVILAQSINEKRYYNEDEETRMACLHIVGPYKRSTVPRSRALNLTVTFFSGLVCRP